MVLVGGNHLSAVERPVTMHGFCVSPALENRAGQPEVPRELQPHTDLRIAPGVEKSHSALRDWTLIDGVHRSQRLKVGRILKRNMRQLHIRHRHIEPARQSHVEDIVRVKRSLPASTGHDKLIAEEDGGLHFAEDLRH